VLQPCEGFLDQPPLLGRANGRLVGEALFECGVEKQNVDAQAAAPGPVIYQPLNTKAQERTPGGGVMADVRLASSSA
jgi:hypothetical protein